MTSHAVNREPKRQRGAWTSAVLVISISVFASVALWAPRSVRPDRLPVLQLDTHAAARAVGRDEGLARHAPHGRWAAELRAAYAEVGRSANQGRQAARAIRALHDRIRTLTRAVRQRHGEQGLWAMRAQVTGLLWEALDARLPERHSREILGGFAEQLVRYGVRDRDGRLVAPRFVARAMFKARWNQVHSLAATAGLAPVEVQAYEGWLALHAEGAPPSLRYAAAKRFASAGGRRGQEAIAVWAARLGHVQVARIALDEALARRRSVRLRNYRIYLAGRPTSALPSARSRQPGALD